MTKQQAIDLLHSKMQSINLRKHCYAVAAAMRALASKFKISDSESPKWEILGLLHDGDYEFTKEDPANHAKMMADWVRETGETNEELLTGIESHGWFHEGKLPQTKMQWSLFCSDELTGLITAVTLVRPERKISLVTVENVLSKWSQKGFAGGVKREDIEHCEKELGIKLPEFIEIVLTAMQGISKELGL